MKHSPIIFFIDDDPDDQYLVRRAMQQLDFNVELVGFESSERLFSHLNHSDPILPDFILLDLNMPMISGKDVLKKLKGSTALSTIPCIIFTTSHSDRDVEESYLLGANSFIIKPGTFAQTVKIMQQLCEYWLNTVTLKAKD